ncbi:hypothetical protein ACR76E_14565 [Thomasclavelia ramosa]|uniref:hypothetical protein n=1 Tax=Thomasclavelia ramosa TaxID=1547 RepID=UPI003DA5623A
MAQDFGDDVGEMLLRSISRYGEKAIGLILNEYFKSAVREWQQAKFEAEGMSKEEAAVKAEAMASREHICMPFGNATDAAYFAQVVRDNGTYAAAMTDDGGNGYVQFAKDDIQKVQECATQFSDVMISLKCREISELITNGKPVTQDKFKNLKLIKDLPDLPKTDGIEYDSHDITLIPVAIRFNDAPDKVEIRTFSEQDTANLDIDSQVFFSGYTQDELADMVGKDTGEDFTIESIGEPYQVKAMELHEDVEKGHADKGESDVGHNERQGHDLANDPYSHTGLIRDKVLAAREQCRDFEDFKAILAENGIGTRLNDEGELQFYEGRLGENGEILDFVNGTDWPVNAKTLAGDRWQCDATLDWFEKNTPKEPTAPEHDSTREVIPPQKDLNLICNAVRSDLEERGIQTLDRADGKMGFVVDQKYKQDVIKAVEARFPSLTPEELGIEFDNGRNDPPNPPTPPAIDGSLDTDGRTPSLDQNIKSHDGMDTDTKTLKLEREQNGTDISPSMVRDQSDRSRESYNLKSKADENRAASKQLSQTNDSPDRDISDKFQQER